jgi:hypothetical protein
MLIRRNWLSDVSVKIATQSQRSIAAMNSQAGRSVRAHSLLRAHFCDVSLVMEIELKERCRRGPSRRLDQLMTRSRTTGSAQFAGQQAVNTQ